MKLLICIASLLSVAYGDRIVGGTDASISDYPWQVSLQYTGNHFCGGSLIHQQYVFTAAQCNGNTLSLTEVVLGTDNIASSEAGTKVGLNSFTSHPSHTSGSTSYDFALIYLSSPVTLSNTINTIALPTANEEPNRNLDATTTGWGFITSGTSHQSTNQLQVATLPLRTDAYCTGVWGSSYNSGTMICAGGDGASSCMGDSGGPLVQYVNGSPLLIGAVSWGSNTCTVDKASVYSQVSVASSWVSSVIGN